MTKYYNPNRKGNLYDPNSVGVLRLSRGKTDSEVKNLANQICNIYTEHRNYNLREIDEENN